MDIEIFCSTCGYKQILETNICGYYLALHPLGELGGDLPMLQEIECPQCKSKEQIHLEIKLQKEELDKRNAEYVRKHEKRTWGFYAAHGE